MQKNQNENLISSQTLKFVLIALPICLLIGILIGSSESTYPGQLTGKKAKETCSDMGSYDKQFITTECLGYFGLLK